MSKEKQQKEQKPPVHKVRELTSVTQCFAPELRNRVMVSITDPGVYARGCAASLDGKMGRIKQRRTDKWDQLSPHVLVEFETPARPWWSGQSPVKAFWLPERDILKGF